MSRPGGMTVPSRWSLMHYGSPAKGCTAMLKIAMMGAEACALGESPSSELPKGATEPKKCHFQGGRLSEASIPPMGGYEKGPIPSLV